MRRAIGRAALAALAVCGCKNDARPPPAADLKPPPSLTPSGSLVGSSPPLPDLESPCGAATVALEFERPNLYFAIDASGSMRESIPRGTAEATTQPVPRDRYEALQIAIQTLLEQVGHRVNYGATLFPSGDESCDSGEEVHRLAPGDTVSFAVSGQLGPVLRNLMNSIKRRLPGGSTPVMQALQGLVPRLTGHGSETYVFLLTDGAPNCNSAARCAPEGCIPNIESAVLSNQISCVAPVNCCAPELLGPEDCLDDVGSGAAVSALAAASIRTFVIGIPGSEEYANVLDELAVRGGMARSGSPSYYGVRDADELVSTVSQLGLGVSLSCTLQLTEAPPDPNLVNVFFDNQLVAADPVDGWVFVDERTVQLVGASCDLLKTGQVLQADVVAGCPVVIR
jgi:hypothetical protein